MVARTLVLFTAAGLGLAGGAVHLVTLNKASTGPSGRVRPLVMPALGPPPITVLAGPPVPESPIPVECPPPSVVVAGIITDEGGMPVGGATVRGPEGMRIHQYHSWRFTVETNGEGRFRAEIPAREVREDWRDEVLSHVDASGYLEGSLEGRPSDWDVFGRGGRIEDLRVVLRCAASVDGTVRDAAGLPSKWAFVEYGTGPLEEIPWRRSIWADEKGQFRIDGLDPREDVRVRASNWGAGSEEHSLFGLLRGGECTSTVVALGKPEGDRARFEGYWEIRGTVVGPDGRPVSGAAVNGQCFGRAPGEGYAAVSGEDGRFEGVLSACDREYDLGRQLWVRHSGHAFLRYSLADAEFDRIEKDRALVGVVLRVLPGAGVAGKVLAPDGTAIPNARIDVTDEPETDDPPTAGCERFRTDEKGAYRIPDLDAECGRFLYVHAEGRKPEWFPLRGRLVAGEEIVLDLVLSPAEE